MNIKICYFSAYMRGIRQNSLPARDMVMACSGNRCSQEFCMVWHYPHPIQALRHLLEVSSKPPDPTGRLHGLRHDRRPGESPRRDLLWKAVKVLLVTNSITDEQAFLNLVHDRALS